MVGLLLCACAATGVAQLSPTQVADTIRHADGTPASGTVVVSWPAFVTVAGDTVPTGNVSTTITAGALSLMLIPNAGSVPVGAYYTAVFHLDDGSVSRQYWIVPISSMAVRLSSIQTTVLPAAVALQSVTKSYVDQAIAAAVGGSGGSGYVQKSGDTMTGPLVLAGDPVAPLQAADKSYVDNATAAVVAGIGQKAHTVTIEHAFTAAGTFNYAHNLGSLYPLMTCYVNSGSSAYTANNLDTNNIAITVTAASDITCTFGI